MPPEAMLAILIFLTVIVLTLIGAWTAVVGIYRAIAVPKQQTAKATISCPWCEQLTTTEHGLCQWCEKSLFNAKARNLADIAAIQKRLRKWQTQGNLDPEKAKELLLQLESEKRVLQGKTPLAMTTAKPAAPKPAPEAPVEAIVVEPAKEEPPAETPAEKPPVAPVAEPVKPTPAPPQPQTPQVAAARSIPEPAPKPVPALVPKPKRPTPPVRPVVEKPPRRTWRELVQTFLEEREIPAVELFGVLLTSPLIITGAVILVIYFWETLQEYPVLKFSAFAAATIGSMLVGLLACIRWQLKTTGRGLLGISLLLVPLSFLAVASSGDQWPVILTEFGVVAAFAWLITWAGRVVVPDRPWHLAAAILAPVVAIIALSIKPELVSLFWSVGLFGVATVAAFATPLVLHRRVIARLDDIKTPTLIGAFFLLGTSIFPLAFALGLAAKISAEKITMGWAIDALSVSLSLAAAAILAFSLTLTQQLEGREKLASWRAAATAVGLTSVLGLVAGLLLAWPWSSLIFTVALIDTAVLVWIAIVCRFPWTHAGAIVTGAATCLTGYHLFAGHLPWRMPVEPATLIHTIFGGTSAAVLVAFSGLLAATAAWFTTQRRKQDAQIYAWGTRRHRHRQPRRFRSRRLVPRRNIHPLGRLRLHHLRPGLPHRQPRDPHPRRHPYRLSAPRRSNPLGTVLAHSHTHPNLGRRTRNRSTRPGTRRLWIGPTPKWQVRATEQHVHNPHRSLSSLPAPARCRRRPRRLDSFRFCSDPPPRSRTIHPHRLARLRLDNRRRRLVPWCLDPRLP